MQLVGGRHHLVPCLHLTDGLLDGGVADRVGRAKTQLSQRAARRVFIIPLQVVRLGAGSVSCQLATFSKSSSGPAVR